MKNNTIRINFPGTVFFNDPFTNQMISGKVVDMTADKELVVETDIKQNNASHARIRTAIETKFVNPEFINNGVKEGDFVNDGKIWKYKVENRKIKCFLSAYTENIEIVDVDEN